MSVANQIPPLNLNPVLIVLQRLDYQFSKNRDDILEGFDSNIQSIEFDIENVNNSISDVESGILLERSTLTQLNVDVDACSAADKNKRKENIITALEDRKRELNDTKSEIEKEREENRAFYKRILDVIRNIFNTLLDLLKRLLDIVATAITTIEGAITTLAGLPLGAGLTGVAVLGFVTTLLQTKIFEPVSDTIDQQETFDETAPI